MCFLLHFNFFHLPSSVQYLKNDRQPLQLQWKYEIFGEFISKVSWCWNQARSFEVVKNWPLSSPQPKKGPSGRWNLGPNPSLYLLNLPTSPIISKNFLFTSTEAFPHGILSFSKLVLQEILYTLRSYFSNFTRMVFQYVWFLFHQKNKIYAP